MTVEKRVDIRCVKEVALFSFACFCIIADIL